MASVVAAFCLGVLLLRAFIRVAPVVGLVDHPGGRKRHDLPTPVVGGLAIFLSALSLLGSSVFLDSGYVWMLPILLLLTLMGLWDDRRDMPYRVRFTVHLMAGLLMAVLAGNVLLNLGDLLGVGDITVGIIAIPLTMFAVASAVNALNLIDGVDGLASGLALIPLSIMSILASLADHSVAAVVAGVFAVTVAAFMLFNYPFPWLTRARCFLGDAGSNILGFVVVWLMIDLSQKGVIDPITALYLLGLPLFDTAGVIIRRRRLGIPPMTPGRDHLHHIFLDAGFSLRATVLTIQTIGLLFAMAGVGLALSGLSEAVAFWVYIASLGAYLFATRSPAVASLRLAVLRERIVEQNHVPLRVIQGQRDDGAAADKALDDAYAAVDWDAVLGKRTAADPAKRRKAS